MVSDKIWQRSDILGTQVITRDTGKRLGVVSQLWVDVDRREVIAVGLRENLLSSLMSTPPDYMLLSSIRQIGDVILVENDDAIEDVDVEGYSNLVNSEVITETGEPLGKVRGFRFNVEDGRVSSLIVASLGLPLIPEQLISTYELPIEEVVSSGPDRLIVFEGAETRMNQMTVGVLERLGIGKAPWENDEDEVYMPMTPASNQLPKGTPLQPPPIRRPQRAEIDVEEENWDEDNWQQPANRPLKRRQMEADYEVGDRPDSRWQEAGGRGRYEPPRSDRYQPPPPERPLYDDDYEDEDYDDSYDAEFDEYEDDYEDEDSAPPLKAIPVKPEPRPEVARPEAKGTKNSPVDEVKPPHEESTNDDIWADEPEPYKPQKLNIPLDKVRKPEYQEEDY